MKNNNKLTRVIALVSYSHPNPFNSSVNIKYTIPINSLVSKRLYDITGSLVDEVVNGACVSGSHTITWDVVGMPTDIYFARMEALGFSQTVKLMLIN